ncbi:MAG TPA: hypothetical protein VFD11_00780 [Thiopseudomonas sp.]|nr:hypothetical protein [Thiopseudomonas sp.]
MKMQVFLTLIIGWLTPLAPLVVQANELYQSALVEMDQAAQLFIAGDDYLEQSVDELTGDRYYSERNFPETASNLTSVFLPDTALDALTRSILLLEAQEAELPHVRYQINYSSHTHTEIPELKHEYIEVTRYNLGPTRRADLLQYVDPEHVASPAEFGVGPHVSWRFAMTPIMGMRANVLYAARKEVSDTTAQQTMCFSHSCLSLEAPELPQGSSPELTPVELAPAAYRADSPSGVARPARVMEALWAKMGTDDPMPYHINKPQFIFVISMDVVGQDSLSLGTGLQALVFDDAIAKVWLQRVQMAGMAPELTQVFISR